MAMFYPRKQVWLILLISIAAVGLTAYYVSGSSKSGEKSASGSGISLKTTSDSAPASNENWKEQFIDNFASSSFKTSSAAVTKTPESAETLTSTQTIGRQLFAQILQLQNSGASTDEDSLSKITDILAANSLVSLRPAITYTYSSLNIIQRPNSSDLKKYSQDLIQILNIYLPNKENNEAVLTMQALEKQDMTLLSRLDPVISNYGEAIKKLIKMPVPVDLSYYHLDLINGISIALNNAQAFKSIDNDPVKGMSAISSSVESLDKMSTAYEAIMSYLSDPISKTN